MRVLVTGSAGFIGFTTSRKLLERGDEVLGIDNLNDYYDVQLKKDRLDLLKSFDKFSFYQLDVSDKEGMNNFFNGTKIFYSIWSMGQARYGTFLVY